MSFADDAWIPVQEIAAQLWRESADQARLKTPPVLGPPSLFGVEVRGLLGDIQRVRNILAAWLSLGPLPAIFEVERPATGLRLIRIKDRRGREAHWMTVEREWEGAPAASLAGNLVDLLDRRG